MDINHSFDVRRRTDDAINDLTSERGYHSEDDEDINVTAGLRQRQGSNIGSYKKKEEADVAIAAGVPSLSNQSSPAGDLTKTTGKLMPHLPADIERRIFGLVTGLGNIAEIFYHSDVKTIQFKFSSTTNFRIFSKIVTQEEHVESRYIVAGWPTPIFRRNPSIVFTRAPEDPVDFKPKWSSNYILFFSQLMDLDDIHCFVSRMCPSERNRMKHIAINDNLWSSSYRENSKLLHTLHYLELLQRIILVSELATPGVEGSGPNVWPRRRMSAPRLQEAVEFISPPSDVPYRKEPYSYMTRISQVESHLNQYRPTVKAWLGGPIEVQLVGIKRDGVQCLSKYVIPTKERVAADLEKELADVQPCVWRDSDRRMRDEGDARYDAIVSSVPGPEDPSSGSDDFTSSTDEDSDDSLE